MANNDVAKGLWPVRHRSGAPYNGGATRYYVPAGDSTALYLGDPVNTAGGADAAGVQTVTKATAGSGGYMLGPVVSVEPITRDSTPYREASTARYVWVADDPDLVFEIQSDGTGGDLAAADIGLNADWVAGTGDATYGRSGAELDTSTAATTNTLQLRILGIVQRPDNEFATNTKAEVAINLHTHRNLTGV